MTSASDRGYWLAERDRRKLLAELEREAYPDADDLVAELYQRLPKEGLKP